MRDAHTLWHEALRSYQDPERFRTFLNSALQTLRNVTFALQAAKRSIPDFEDWYAPWQERLRANAVMAWAVEARNRVAKASDLETSSVAVVSLVASYGDLPAMELEVEPLLDTREIAAFVLRQGLPSWARKHGILVVERSWRVPELPGKELLEVLAYAFGVLNELVFEAHLRMEEAPAAAEDCVRSGFTGPHAISRAAGWRPSCMIAAAEQRSVIIRLGTEAEMRTRATRVKHTQDQLEAAARRYGQWPRQEGPEQSSPREIAAAFFDQARRVFVRDGYHLPFAFIFGSDGKLNVVALRMDDQAEKHLVHRRIARQVEVTRAEVVFFIGESWVAPLGSGPPDESPARQEVLDLTFISRPGEYFSWFYPILRTDAGVDLGPKVEGAPGLPIYVEPILNVWRKWDREGR